MRTFASDVRVELLLLDGDRALLELDLLLLAGDVRVAELDFLDLALLFGHDALRGLCDRELGVGRLLELGLLDLKLVLLLGDLRLGLDIGVVRLLRECFKEVDKLLDARLVEVRLDVRLERGNLLGGGKPVVL